MKLKWIGSVVCSLLWVGFGTDAANADGKTIFGETAQATKKAMKQVVKDLGVRQKGGCTYCHVKDGGTIDWEAASPHKKTAYVMKTDFVDQLVKKGRVEATIDDHGKKLKLVATYVKEGENAGIDLSGVLGEGETATHFQRSLPLPKEGAQLSCATCHNGSTQIFARAEEKKDQ